ncbi:MAG: hypothetical protein ABGF52_02675 [Candidatus Asgardarchaeum sp.]
MVRRGQRILEGVEVQISKIEQLLTPSPTVSDKDAADLAQKIRYLIDQTEAILAQTDIKLSAFRDVLKGAGNRDFTTLETDVESIDSKFNVDLATRARESTLSDLNAKIKSQSADLFVNQ